AAAAYGLLRSRQRLTSRRAEPSANVAIAKVPEQSRHDAEPLACDRREQVLVGGVLRAAGGRMRDPDRAQTEHVGKAVVGHRSAEVGQNGRGAPRGRLERTGGETDPWILWVEPAGAKESAPAAAHLDLGETVAVEVTAQRRNDVVDVRSHHVPQ